MKTTTIQKSKCVKCGLFVGQSLRGLSKHHRICSLRPHLQFTCSLCVKSCHFYSKRWLINHVLKCHHIRLQQYLDNHLMDFILSTPNKINDVMIPIAHGNIHQDSLTKDIEEDAEALLKFQVGRPDMDWDKIENQIEEIVLNIQSHDLETDICVNSSIGAIDEDVMTFNLGLDDFNMDLGASERIGNNGMGISTSDVSDVTIWTKFVKHKLSGIENLETNSRFSSEIELLNILRRCNAPLHLYSDIMKWAHMSSIFLGYDFKERPLSRP